MATTPRPIERRARAIIKAAARSAGLKHHFEVLVGEITPEIITNYKERGLEVAAQARVKTGVGDVIDRGAAKYARARGSELIKDFARTTPDMLQATLEQSLLAGESVHTLRAKLYENYAFSSTRSLAIARTETNNARRAGGQIGAESAGAVRKHWQAGPGPCQNGACPENEDAGWIGIKDEFPNGDNPHPNCTCSIDYQTEATQAEQAEGAEDDAE